MRSGVAAVEYRGVLIHPATPPSGFRYFIQFRHNPTGVLWTKEECPHFRTLAEARKYIRGLHFPDISHGMIWA